MQTISGRDFWPLDPRPEDFDIQEIAWSLSMQVRYTGHVKYFYCVAPETKILTDDLHWISAGDLALGDRLVGFDEFAAGAGEGGKPRRKVRPSTVLHEGVIVRPCYELEMEDGTKIVSSADHPWLISAKAARNQSWVKTEVLAKDVAMGRKRWMIRFFRPWNTRKTWDSGYVSGAFDGEGYISGRSGGLTVAFAQKPGLVLDRIRSLLTDAGIGLRSEYLLPSGVTQLQLNGGWPDRLSFLGSYRPLRLVDNFTRDFRLGRYNATFGGNDMLQIVSVRFIGNQEVVALETSTHTYFAEGFGAHNSVAEHCVLVSKFVPEEYALWGLLHDASEAYINDISRPVKVDLDEYKRIEEYIMIVFSQAFNLPWPMPAAVKAVDNRIVMDERAALLNPSWRMWNLNEEPLGAVIDGLYPDQAYNLFMNRYMEILGKA
jgi:hypothetical protein